MFKAKFLAWLWGFWGLKIADFGQVKIIVHLSDGHCIYAGHILCCILIPSKTNWMINIQHVKKNNLCIQAK